MHRIIRAAAFFLLLMAVVAPRVGAQRPERISPSITLWPDVDPIEDTDYSNVQVAAVPVESGYSHPAHLSVRCYGVFRSGYFAYDEPVVGATHLVWRFDGNAPDTIALPREPAMRAYGGPGVWMVMYRPLGIVSLPEPALEAILRDGARASRMVVRLTGPETRRDSYFTLTGFSRALDRLSCLRPAAAAQRRERMRGRPLMPGEKAYYDVASVDEEPVPLDSAATAAALRREIPASALADASLGYVLSHLEVNAEGGVDSVTVVAAVRAKDGMERFLRTLRFRPARINGEAVAVRVAVYVQNYDPRR